MWLDLLLAVSRRPATGLRLISFASCCIVASLDRRRRQRNNKRKRIYCCDDVSRNSIAAGNGSLKQITWRGRIETSVTSTRRRVSTEIDLNRACKCNAPPFGTDIKQVVVAGADETDSVRNGNKTRQLRWWRQQPSHAQTDGSEKRVRRRYVRERKTEMPSGSVDRAEVRSAHGILLGGCVEGGRARSRGCSVRWHAPS